MNRTISFRSGAVYTGATAFDIVEQMRAADFDPPPTVRDYIARAIVRAATYFEKTLQLNPQAGTEQELAERFLTQAIAKGLAEELTLS